MCDNTEVKARAGQQEGTVKVKEIPKVNQNDSKN